MIAVNFKYCRIWGVGLELCVVVVRSLVSRSECPVEMVAVWVESRQRGIIDGIASINYDGWFNKSCDLSGNIHGSLIMNGYEA